MSRRSRRRDGPSGFLLVDKEPGLTSHDVVGRLRRRFDTPRVGHAGTLDPDATGLLLVGIGQATRLLTFLVGLPKTYEATIAFGAATSTQDASGDVLERFDMPALTPDRVAAGAAAMLGPSEQIPPMVSAVRVDGRRLHELAREGKEVEREPRRIRVDRFDTAPIDGDASTEDASLYRAVVECSSGTYVRTLAHDLGAALGGGAHLATLRRTKVGRYDVADAGRWEETPLRSLVEAVAHLDHLRPPPETLRRVVHGSVMERIDLGADPDASGPWAVLARPSEIPSVPVPADGPRGASPPQASGASSDAETVVAIYGAHKGSTLKPEAVLVNR